MQSRKATLRTLRRPYSWQNPSLLFSSIPPLHDIKVLKLHCLLSALHPTFLILHLPILPPMTLFTHLCSTPWSYGWSHINNKMTSVASTFPPCMTLLWDYVSYSLSTSLLARAAEHKFLYNLNQTGSPHSSPMGQALSSSIMLPTEIGIMWKRSASSLFLERLHLEGQVDGQESSKTNNPDGFPAGILHWHCQKYWVVFSASQLRCFTPHYYYSPEKFPGIHQAHVKHHCSVFILTWFLK